MLVSNLVLAIINLDMIFFSNYLGNPTEYFFNFPVINESDVLTNIKKLRTKYPTGVD